MPEIKWNITIQHRAVKEFVRLRLEDPTTLSKDLWQKAIQNTVDISRMPKRKNYTTEIEYAIKKVWDNHIQSMNEKIKAAEEIQTPQEVEEETVEDTPIQTEEIEDTPTESVMSDISSIPDDVLIDEITNRMNNKLKSILSIPSVPTNRVSAESASKIIGGYIPPTVKKPKKEYIAKVAIVGLLPEQQNTVISLYDGNLKLKFYDKEKSSARIDGNCDWGICTRHSGHDYYEKLKKIVLNDVLFINTSPETVVSYLNDIESKYVVSSRR